MYLVHFDGGKVCYVGQAIFDAAHLYPEIISDVFDTLFDVCLRFDEVEESLFAVDLLELGFKAFIASVDCLQLSFYCWCHAFEAVDYPLDFLEVSSVIHWLLNLVNICGNLGDAVVDYSVLLEGLYLKCLEWLPEWFHNLIV